MFKLTIVATLLLSCTMLQSGNLEEEFRGVWLATAWGGIDYPMNKITISGDSTQIALQKSEFISILDSLQKVNINAIMFQVRGHGDAFYRSSYEPWSRALTGIRGMDPGYDPFAFVIEAAHARDIEVHAWINPYRISNYTPNAAAVKNSWILAKGSAAAFLDPGNAKVKHFTLKVIEEIINNYNIDGIVFDDYFYKSMPVNDCAKNETHPTRQNNPYDLTIDDWRRENINSLMKSVHELIKELKPQVRFGISPFGVYSTETRIVYNEERTECDTIYPAAGIKATDSYATMYCDAAAWLKRGYIDYISPQLYWPSLPTSTDYRSTLDYEVLCSWWSDLAKRYNKPLYTSNDVAFNGKGRRFNSPEEIVNQLEINEGKAQGIIFYNANSFLNTRGTNSYFTDKSESYHSFLTQNGYFITKTAPYINPSTSNHVSNNTQKDSVNNNITTVQVSIAQELAPIFRNKKGISIMINANTAVQVYTINDRLIYQDETNKSVNIDLARGTYLIKINNKEYQITI